MSNDIYFGKTAAELLKHARTTGRRKRELTTIARQLCIREDFLEAIETGEYKKIPELVYLLGFARNLAIELELDPDIIVNKIKLEMGIIKENDESEPVPVPVKPRRGILSIVRSFIGRVISNIVRFWKWLAGLVVVILVIIAGFYLVSMVANNQRTDNAPIDAAQDLAQMPVPEYKIPVKEQFGTENRGAASVILQANAETWLKVEDSKGSTLFSRVMMPGDVYYAPATGPKATVGNAGGLDVYVNGKLAPKLGADHTRKSGITLSPAALISE
ncbi:MAG: DUF4115 domain-containing protein [Alphaproteobacteria bacterium]|nr:DUF4115 domain-containing protein [Alphaproteobacteria bacterium]